MHKDQPVGKQPDRPARADQEETDDQVKTKPEHEKEDKGEEKTAGELHSSTGG
jgi:hypothetical protein